MKVILILYMSTGCVLSYFSHCCAIHITVNSQQFGSLSFMSEDQLRTLLFIWTIITLTLERMQHFSLWANSSRPEHLYFLLYHTSTAYFWMLFKILVRCVEFQPILKPWPERLIPTRHTVLNGIMHNVAISVSGANFHTYRRISEIQASLVAQYNQQVTTFMDIQHDFFFFFQLKHLRCERKLEAIKIDQLLGIQFQSHFFKYFLFIYDLRYLVIITYKY